MNNAELTELMYRILELVILDSMGDTVRPCEELKTSEILDAIRAVSGEEPSLRKLIGDDVIEGLYEDYHELSAEELKARLREENGFPEEILGEKDIEWLQKKFTKMKRQQQKPGPKKATVETKTDKTKELLKKLYKLISGYKCGDAITFPEELLGEVCKEIFGRGLTLFDVYTEKEIREDLLWDYSDGPDEEMIVAFLIDEKEISKSLLTKEVIGKLIKIVQEE